MPTPEPAVPPTATLSLRHVGVAYDTRVVLSEIDWSPTSGQVNLLYGAAGSGKSTLLKAIAGWQRRVPGMRVWGAIEIRGHHGPGEACALVHQTLGFFVSTVGRNLVAALPDRSSLSPQAQRERITQTLERLDAAALLSQWDSPVSLLDTAERQCLCLLTALLQGCTVLLLDEPCARLGADDAAGLRALLDRLALERLVIVATHDAGDVSAFRQARPFALGTRLQETPTQAQSIASPSRRPAAPLGIRRVAPSGFHWVHGKTLAALARPGLLESLETDLQLLDTLGIGQLLCLEEVLPYDPAQLPPSLSVRHFPIVDMLAPPSLPAVQALIRALRADAASGLRTGVHCRAGLGRTGTIVGCYVSAVLDLDGAGALAAIRRINPRFVQTEAQAEFVEAFSRVRGD